MNIHKLFATFAAAGALLLAQAPQEFRVERDVMIQRSPQPGTAVMHEPMRVEVMQMMPFEGGIGVRAMKNSPYSAEAVTEFRQQLSDGNRITRRSVDHLYRDSEGRTRKETTIANVGPWAAGGQKLITIADPAAGSVVVLDSVNKTARKSITRMDTSGGGGEPIKVRTAGPGGPGMPAGPGGPQTMVFDSGIDVAGLGGGAASHAMKVKFRNEDLGKRIIDGVEAQGTRTIQTIEAGSIGNDREIEVVSERWFSTELGTLLMSRHIDPRSGETTYTLSNIRRAEPAHDLFEIPADYKVNESSNYKWVEKIEKIERK